MGVYEEVISSVDMPHEGNPFAQNPEFLQKKFPELPVSTEASQAAHRAAIQEGKTVPEKKPLARIQNYLDRLNEIVARKDPKEKERGLEAIKRLLYRTAVIKPEHIPEAYWDLQKRIAREQGHGDIEITPQLKAQQADVLISDQKGSLDTWVDYLSSPDATYPDWLKYWATRSVLGMAEYDKEKKEFGRRTKGTVKPFPDLNREALAYVLDAVQKKYAKEKIDLDRFEQQDQQKFNELLKGESFPKLYAWAVDKVNPTAKELLTVTEGRWVKYDKGSDPKPLVKAIQPHGTGWCTAGESTAKTQLDAGDFYVYYSIDEQGRPSIPRAAIRMEGDGGGQQKIAEVRGIAENQNLDPYIGDVVQAKMKEFPDGKQYEKKASDMRRLTAIEKKTNNNQPLTKEDLRFLYEMDSEVDGFGYGRDPRVKEIQDRRDRRGDLMVIFDAKEDEVADAHAPFTDKTKVLIGDLILVDDVFPGQFVWIEGEVHLPGYDYSKHTAMRLIEVGQSSAVAKNLKKFQELDEEIANKLIDAEQGYFVVGNLRRFQLSDAKIANKLIDEGSGHLVVDFLRSFKELDEEIANKLIDVGYGDAVVGDLGWFRGLNAKIAIKLIDAGYIFDVAMNLDKFQGLDEATLRRLKEYA